MKISDLNNTLAEKITGFVGSMWCAYAFAALAVYGFPYHNLTTPAVVQWVSQEFLQLVLLSVIMVGQSVQAEKTAHLHDKVDNLHQKVDSLTP